MFFDFFAGRYPVVEVSLTQERKRNHQTYSQLVYWIQSFTPVGDTEHISSSDAWSLPFSGRGKVKFCCTQYKYDQTISPETTRPSPTFVTPGGL